MTGAKPFNELAMLNALHVEVMGEAAACRRQVHWIGGALRREAIRHARERIAAAGAIRLRADHLRATRYGLPERPFYASAWPADMGA
jgi:hypothetical protein